MTWYNCMLGMTKQDVEDGWKRYTKKETQETL